MDASYVASLSTPLHTMEVRIHKEDGKYVQVATAVTIHLQA